MYVQYHHHIIHVSDSSPSSSLIHTCSTDTFQTFSHSCVFFTSTFHIVTYFLIKVIWL